jgi:hypothetical protein
VTETAPRAYLEVVPKRAFAVAIDWPGWSRAGKSPELALENFLAYAPRYAVVAREAGLPLPAGLHDVDVVERIEGDAATEFGVPGRIALVDRTPISGPDAGRQSTLVRAAWTVFDRTAAAAPTQLRKGPRGGGRDTARIIEHVVTAEHAYSRELGIRTAAPDAADRAAVWELRELMLDVLARPSDGQALVKRWTARYAARRIAWHALDHAWEIEDRSET